MKRLMIAVIAGAFAGLMGCQSEGDKAPAQDKTPAKAKAAKAVAAKEAATSQPAAMPDTTKTAGEPAAAAMAADDKVAVVADFEDEADAQINEDNYDAMLEALEKEMASD